ncbi:hypothetical protein [Proteus vulgaris]|uniref:Uncharacterized protein n=1 Tax=Proteus vulgaris TaxID=585 RepID=A0A6G6SJT4_PROVU|nr:hypothetical protein [Proteus vulgaris]QIF94071.1 hypothetical protein GTH24_09250 [Proteus vulgaris]WIF74031.1 hypothetical protein QN092_09175 [Proteus vulgaris]
MKIIYLCIIGISGYEGPDFILGAFDNRDIAEKAKMTFIKDNQNEENQVKVLTEKDRWIEVEEVKLSSFSCDIPLSDFYYIISRFSEGFGQIYRDIEAIFDNYENALSKLEQLEKEYNESDASFPEYFAIEKLQSNQVNAKTVTQWLASDFFGDDNRLL